MVQDLVQDLSQKFPRRVCMCSVNNFSIFNTFREKTIPLNIFLKNTNFLKMFVPNHQKDLLLHTEGFSNGVSRRQRGFQSMAILQQASWILCFQPESQFTGIPCVCIAHTTDLRTLCQMGPQEGLESSHLTAHKAAETSSQVCPFAHLTQQNCCSARLEQWHLM